MNQSERPDAQGKFAVTGIDYATSLFGEARQRESPLSIQWTGRAEQANAFLLQIWIRPLLCARDQTGFWGCGTQSHSSEGEVLNDKRES